MRFATLRTATGTRAALVRDGAAFAVDYPDVGAALAAVGLDGLGRLAPVGPGVELAEAEFAPIVTAPEKIICVGLNYRSHILEMKRDLPRYPTLFAKFANSLIGAYDDIVLPAVSDQVDWEVELGIVIGAPIKRATADDARRGIAGFTIVNDISMRDWQGRTNEWLQGKAFEASTPAGPLLVTGDELDDARDLAVRCDVDGVSMQVGRTSDLLFDPAEIVAYASQFTTLKPGDLIATGTPGGVGAGREPKVFLAPGQTVRTAVEGIGECVNICREEKA